MGQPSTGQKHTEGDTEERLRGALEGMPASFQRSLRAQNKVDTTIVAYMGTLRFFYTYLAQKGMPLAIGSIKREHIESWLIHLRSTPNARTGQPVSSATLGKHYKALHIYFEWARDDGEIRDHPMAKMKRPLLPESPPPVLESAQIDRLLKACSGKDFYARRDTAIIRLLLDTGARVSEIVGLHLEDIDWQHDLITVMGKGRKQRQIPFGRKTAQALDRYKRSRDTYPTKHLPDVWLGHSGKPLTTSGVRQMLQDRGKVAGIEGLHPHMFRHQMAQSWIESGGSEVGLMRLAGWASRSMIGRYTAGAQTKLAHEEHRRINPGDKY